MMITELLIRAFLGLIRGSGYVYWFVWRRNTYVPYHDDIEPLEIPCDWAAGAKPPR
ncbi:hypothetical protein [Streptomyces sp. NPDC056304]|uniref:hypothetical protein n=1 Tax=Streptomyces sp. NPDC056304 TaxID=3345778 RepID=UPI0035DDB591